ncbi:hypothetical protein CVT25_001695 [Psilocybe cyanescens]|uniref:CCHC-type domain-containing protein n=1 Tax=Psilocybe cyanescens TaxID=93625 RepID=A0A409X5A6_PSICY|nr:hypothetical protein CVT25_001695 [Psilocybe cyanescens]
MGINKDVYDTEPKRIAFILSYMQEGNVVVWKQQFVQNKLNLDTGDINLPTYKEFINEFQKAFKPEEEDIDALDKLNMLRQKNLTAEQLVTKFKLLVGEAGMSNDSDTANKLLIEKFKTALNPALVQKIIQSEKRPTKIEEWYDKAMSFDRSYRLAMAIKGPPQSNTRFIPKSAPRKDPFAMDVDVMTTEERTSLMKKGACFRCKQTGHLAVDCPQRKKNNPFIPKELPKKKWTAKDLHAHIRELNMEEREELASLAMGDQEEDTNTEDF